MKKQGDIQGNIQGGAPATTPRIGILLVEDHVSTAKLIAANLMHDLSCTVQLAHTLAAARQILNQPENGITVVIADLNLPDGMHLEIINAIKPFGKPIIALTAEYSDALREMILKSGVVDYVLKNFPAAFQYLIDLIGRIERNAHTKVLVVDDSAASRHLLRLYLSLQGLQVLTAHNGMSAMVLLNQHADIRLMLTDYEMPTMDGVSLVVEVRKTIKKDQMAIIGISASQEGQLSVRFLKNGANDFINKPFVYEEVLCRVSQNLEMLDMMQTCKNIAIRDFLTGLYNRRHFFEEGAKLLKNAAQKGWPVAVTMIDIDHFKRVNDTFGHDWGDIALKQTASNLDAHFAGNLCCRLGGEEFAVLFINQEANAVLGLLEQFRQSQQDKPVLHQDGTLIAVNVSLGLEARQGPAAPFDLHDLIKEADLKLYRAKQNGRNQCVM